MKASLKGSGFNGGTLLYNLSHKILRLRNAQRKWYISN